VKKYELWGKHQFAGESEDRIRSFIDFDRHECYHESLYNPKLAELSVGRAQSGPVLKE
jgi:hypothetical protein